MRLIPEYEPVEKLLLCFVHDFFNTRFGYGRTLCTIIKAAQQHVAIEVFVSPEDAPHFEVECQRQDVSLEHVTVNADSPGRAILAEWAPIFARGDEQDEKEITGVIFENPFLERAAELLEHSRRLTTGMGFGALELGFPFSTAQLLVNEDVVLLSDSLFKGEDREARLAFFSEYFPDQEFHLVSPLAGDVTRDLDMFLWPIAPRAWIVSEYAAGTPQAESIEPSLRVLRERGHMIHRVPGLEPIIVDDINTMPNYANGVILNRLALVPAYQRAEDAVVVGILREYGYQVAPIDCSQVILTNSGIHCISRTVPRRGA